jgi:signal transduction histidine kinase
MKRLRTGGTTGQIAAIVVIALLVAHGLSAIVWLSFDMRPGPPPEFIRPVAQIGLVTQLLAVLPAEDRAAVLSVAAESGLLVRESAGPPPTFDADDDTRLGGLRHALRQEHGLLSRIRAIGRVWLAEGQPANPAVTVGPAAAGGRWLLFEIPASERQPSVPLRWLSSSGAASVVAIPLLVGLISIWAARRVTSPLVRLAAATEGISLLHDPSPVAEEGAREVRRLARAFNEMQEKLRRFIVDRTHTLAAVGHDLRTPLTRLRLRAETVDDPTTRSKMLRDIRTMESMITSTLAYIREEAAQEPAEQVDVAVLLQTVCDDFDDAGSEVRYDGPLHCSASCRPLALHRALNNLIDNAVKFGAVAAVRLEVLPASIAITVEDDGPGIADAHKDSVFKPFFRGAAPDRYQIDDGFGLGLSLVGAIVESHNGTIELFDRTPSGLGVRLVLPR